jgi:hypothetical protein
MVLTAKDEDPLPLVEGEPAFLLDEGVAYVRGWAQAQHAVSALKQALADLGQDNAIPHLRADVNVFGAGIVELGCITPQTATLIAEALKTAASQKNESHDGCAA